MRQPVRLVLVLGLASIIAACFCGQWLFAAGESQAKAPSAKAAMLFSITKGAGHLQAVSMALGMAGTAAKDGHEVVVFLSVEGPQLADRGLGDDVKIADFPPVKAMLADVIASGGKVLVCGHCAEMCKLMKASLVDGATPCTREEFLQYVKPGMVCMSY